MTKAEKVLVVSVNLNMFVKIYAQILLLRD